MVGGRLLSWDTLVTWRRGWDLLGASFMRVLSPLLGLQPHDLSTCQRPHTLVSLPWGLDFNK